MQKTRELLGRHWMILPHAVAIALLVALPMILFPLLAKDQYQGINIAHFGTDQHFYLTRARDVLDGHGLGNSFLREGKDAQDPFFTWNERVLLAPYRWLGIADQMNVSTLYTIMNAIGIFLLVILIYALVYQLSDNKLLSMTIPVAIIGGSSLVFYRQFFIDDPSLYGRAMSPYISSLALFTYLNFLVRSLVRPRPRTIALTALAFGALFYVYLFAWSYALTLTGLLLVIYLVRRQWDRGKMIAMILGGGLVLGSYNLFFLVRSLISPESQALRYFHYMDRTHAPTFSSVGAVLLILLAGYWWRHRRDERLPILIATVLAGWAVVNQQILTGMRIQPGHFHWYFVVPMGILIAVFIVWSLLRKRLWQIGMCVVVLVGVYTHLAIGQYRAAYKTLPQKIAEQRFAPLLSELKKDSKPSVILGYGDTFGFLPVIYTHHDVFWHNAATYYHPTEERMRDALIVSLVLHSDARAHPQDFIQRALDGNFVSDYYPHLYRSLEGFTSGWTYPEYNRMQMSPTPEFLAHRRRLMEDLSQRVKQYATDPTTLQRLLERYGVKYVVWDAQADPKWEVSILKGAREIRAAEDLHLYRLESS